MNITTTFKSLFRFLLITLFSVMLLPKRAIAISPYYLDKNVPQKDLFEKALINTYSSTFQLISRDRPGELFIKGKWLNAQQIAQFLQTEMKHSVLPICNLNIYGCEFAKGDKGLQAVTYLEKSLGLSVSASTNITGIDGDWNLKVAQAKDLIAINNYIRNSQNKLIQSANCSTCLPGTIDPEGTPTTASSIGSIPTGALQTWNLHKSPISISHSLTTAQASPASVSGKFSGKYYTLLDSDGDGVTDDIDLDDDNDGIMDTLECPVLQYQRFAPAMIGYNSTVSAGTINVSNFDMSSSWGLPAGSVLVSITDAGAIYPSTNFTTDNVYQPHITFSGTVPVIIKAVHFRQLQKGYDDGIISTDGSTYTYISSLASGLSSHNSPSNTYYIQNDSYATAGALTAAQTTEYIWQSAGTVSSITFYSTNTASFNAFEVDIKPQYCRDTDGDGIPDYLDLDSDGDGCPDALEGGLALAASNLQNSAMPGGNTGAGFTGISPNPGPVTKNLGNTVGSTPTTLGIPTIAGTGQTIGTSEDVTLQSANCIVCLAGTAAPTHAGTLSNVCPATTADLSTFTASACPTGSSLEWHTSATVSAATLYATPAAASAGTYYATCHDATNNCYSPASTGVVVSITVCCQAGTAPPTLIKN